MKKLIIAFVFLFAGSTFFTACKDAERDTEEVEIMEDEVDSDAFEMEEGAVEEGFGAFDTNTDSMLDETEFDEANKQAFSEWDEDQNSSLNNNEFYRSTFALIDANRDGQIDESEWNQGREDLYRNYATENSWTNFDANKDGYLSSQEWNEGFANSEWFNEFDENNDNIIDRDEWRTSFFASYDANEDGYLDANEYKYQRNMSGS